MPRPHSTIPSYLPPLHLYRHILREASYLPPAIRPPITTHIRTRIRAHREHDRLQYKRRARAANLLRRLRAANSGQKSQMEDFIMEAFARKGARRRSLLSHFVRIEPPSDSDALEALIQRVEADRKSPKIEASKADETAVLNKSSPNNASETTIEDKFFPHKIGAKGASHTLDDEKESKSKLPMVRKGRGPDKTPFFDKWDTNKLRSLLHAQRELQQSTKLAWPRKSIKTLNPDSRVPAKNIWGERPTPNIFQAKRAGFWRRSATKVMPPLSSDEWDLLGRLSKGAQEEEEWRIPERRPAAKPVLAAESKPSTLDWDWESHATQPTNKVEHLNRLSSFAFVGRDKTNHPYESKHGSKELSPRWFRRAYQRVWQFTPKMDSDAETGKAEFLWGTLTHPAVPPTKGQLSIFEGLNSRGEKAKDASPSQKTPKPKPKNVTQPLDTPK
ncbi:hypothetical protein F53441_8776 [Fusarium austroafricanum]|uniref:LYR motif-containing protein Cup1-like N-terminal domain-containing protein n=1 Tax=Fusarium austroafricanum TaxID=2364996 RepID=A0A8H4KAN4_9HYPO|nr:hypothetical protein F53441_8776 [Fusarium austroafricanum]